jgi:hypothetical protein
MITLKEATLYLPYKVKMKISYQGKEKIDTLDIRKSAYLLENIDKWEFKLILRPLPDLNKEIEIEGEKIIPGEVLSEMIDEEHMGYNDHYFDYEKNKYIIEDPRFEPYFIVQQLLEWHFWIGDQSRFGQDIILK